MDRNVTRPSKVIKQEMVKRGLTQKDIALIIGKSDSYVSNNLLKEKISIEFAQELSLILGNTPQYWLDIGNKYQLAFLDEISSDVRKRNKILQEYPLKDMQNRGWISKTENFDDLKVEVEKLIQHGVSFEENATFKRTLKEQDLNYAEKFWLYRAAELAKMLPVEKYDESRLESLFKLLQKAVQSSKAVHKVAELLQRYGIRFVVVQPLPNAKIDGAAFWLDENSPVVALSIRYDNIGSFWFALIHELIHIKNKDFFSVDNLHEEATDEVEKKTNKEAAAFLVPQNKLKAFINSTAPYFSKAKINNFAMKLKIHPGIIVGQLQHKNQIGFNTHHESMVKIRELATMTAFTDGWGHPVPIGNKQTQRGIKDDS